MTVKRYKPRLVDGEMWLEGGHPDGEYVLASDYDALRRERDELREVVDRRDKAIAINWSREKALRRELDEVNRASESWRAECLVTRRERDALLRVVEAYLEPAWTAGRRERLQSALDAYYAEYGGQDE